MNFNKQGLGRALVVSSLGLAAVFGANATDITIFDKVAGNTFGAADSRGIQEDNETEPGTVNTQAWDLEAFHLNGNSLSMVGGYNFELGVDSLASGDIFIDVNGDAVWGTDVGGGNTVLVNNSMFKYDYVISFGGRALDGSLNSTDESLDGSYKIFKLTGTSQDVTVTFASNAEANPWIYFSGGEEIASFAAQSVTQQDLGIADYMGLKGGRHYKWGNIDLTAIATDLGGALPSGTLFKFTMECGNDNLIGRVSDGGTTVALLGLGLLGLGAVRRRIA